MSVRPFKRRTPAGTISSGWVVDVVFINLDGVEERYRRHPKRHTRADALALERKLITWLSERDARLQQNRSPTFITFSAEFLANYATAHNKPSELHSKKLILKNHLLPFFGAMKLSAIGNRAIDTYKAQCLRIPLAAKTINNHLAVLRRMLSPATEYGLLDARVRIKALRAPQKEAKFLTEVEARQLLANLAWPWLGMVAVALQAGLRLGEILALRLQETDIERQRIIVCRNDWRGIVSSPKGHLSRTIPLSSLLAKTLADRKEDICPKKSDELVFARENGEALTYQQCRRPLLRACKQAGIQPVMWHALRHTFASHLVMRGASLKAVQELLGHTTQAMTERYAHLTPQVREHAIALFDG